MRDTVQPAAGGPAELAHQELRRSGGQFAEYVNQIEGLAWIRRNFPRLAEQLRVRLEQDHV